MDGLAAACTDGLCTGRTFAAFDVRPQTNDAFDMNNLYPRIFRYVRHPSRSSTLHFVISLCYFTLFKLRPLCAPIAARVRFHFVYCIC